MCRFRCSSEFLLLSDISSKSATEIAGALDEDRSCLADAPCFSFHYDGQFWTFCFAQRSVADLNQLQRGESTQSHGANALFCQKLEEAMGERGACALSHRGSGCVDILFFSRALYSATTTPQLLVRRGRVSFPTDKKLGSRPPYSVPVAGVRID